MDGEREEEDTLSISVIVVVFLCFLISCFVGCFCFKGM